MPVLHKEFGSINMISQLIKDYYEGKPLILSLEVVSRMLSRSFPRISIHSLFSL